jgi:hypothetical protein
MPDHERKLSLPNKLERLDFRIEEVRESTGVHFKLGQERRDEVAELVS